MSTDYTGDAVMANKARQPAWRKRDAERDAMLAWNDAARRFAAQLHLACHNCGAAGAALVCPRCQHPTCDQCMITRLDLCAPCVIEAQRAQVLP